MVIFIAHMLHHHHHHILLTHFLISFCVDVWICLFILLDDLLTPSLLFSSLSPFSPLLFFKMFSLLSLFVLYLFRVCSLIVSSHLHPVVSTHHSGRISSLHDSSLSHSLYLFNLLHSIKTNLVQWHLVELPQTHNPTDSEAATNTTTTTTSTAAAAARMSGMSVESRVSNARYFLSLARKLGADLFCTPLDILECKQNSILLILATLMTIDMEMNSNN